MWRCKICNGEVDLITRRIYETVYRLDKDTKKAIILNSKIRDDNFKLKCKSCGASIISNNENVKGKNIIIIVKWEY